MSATNASKEKLKRIAYEIIGENRSQSSLAKLFLKMVHESKSTRSMNDSEILHEIFMFLNQHKKPCISSIPENKTYLKILLDYTAKHYVLLINNIITCIPDEENHA